MRFECVRRAALAVAMVWAASGAAGQESFAARFEARLTDGRIAEAEAVARDGMAALPDDPVPQFALGIAQFLAAVEGLGQGLHRYGLASTYGNPTQLLGGGVPFIRVPVPANPAPEPVTYEGLREVLAKFTADLAVAEETLAGVPDGAFELKLRVPAIRFDFDGDGAGSEAESVAAVFLAVTGADLSPDWAAWSEGVRSGAVAPFVLDQSDVPWLQAYCHLLSALAKFPLAHDWREAFELTLHDAFPASRLPSSGLLDEERRVLDALGPEVPPYDWQAEDASWEGHEAWLQTPEGQAWQEQSRLTGALEFGGLADLGAFVHLMHWPVVEPDRMAEVRTHLLSMVALSRENWRRILAETDDKREWVPGPAQTVLFENVRITEETVAGWHLFLDEFEAVLEGRRLVPHWRVASGRGVNVRRMFEDPRTFDPILIAQGTGVLPYLEDGETVSIETVGTILALTEGGLLGYFIWFN